LNTLRWFSIIQYEIFIYRVWNGWKEGWHIQILDTGKLKLRQHAQHFVRHAGFVRRRIANEIRTKSPWSTIGQTKKEKIGSNNFSVIDNYMIDNNFIEVPQILISVSEILGILIPLKSSPQRWR